ncbi:MAG: 23S rRNA (uracil(1939)-C(5))-methyltransferase RlmD [Planctomycetota bacterium]|nr:MAG: 23S rRNA (uracil(1939)-C(5))-methyltransferase RlmD [Planctomycetota bacterium]
MAKKKRIEVLDVVDFSEKGEGVGRWKNKKVLLPFTIPGEKVEAEIGKGRKGLIRGKVKAVLEKSPFREDSPCPYFQACGGCTFQHLSYSKELEWKYHLVRRTLKKALPSFSEKKILPPLESPQIYRYRNKMELSFSRKRWLTTEEIQSQNEFRKDFALGMHVRGRFDRVVYLRQCHLLSQKAEELLSKIGPFFEASGLSIYHSKSHEGFLRFAILREAFHTGEIMVNWVSSIRNEAFAKEVASFLAGQGAYTVINNISSRWAQVSYGDQEYVDHGLGYILEKLGDFTFQISSQSFFQVNTLQVERMYRLIPQWLELRKEDIVYDFYSGIGTISIYLSPHVKKVIGFEIIPQAIQNSLQNCEINRVQNCQFIQGDVKDYFQNPSSPSLPKPQVILLDPPRPGVHPKVLSCILQIRPREILYISCNPLTLARDLAYLTEKGDYDIQKVQPIDMFPRTPHIESLVLLKLRK